MSELVTRLRYQDSLRSTLSPFGTLFKDAADRIEELEDRMVAAINNVAIREKRIEALEAREQKLVDIMFQVAQVAAEQMHGKSQDEICGWVSAKLRECGFPTRMMGSSWGILDEIKGR